MQHLMFTTLAILLGMASSVFAGDDRYTLEKTADGFVRMDRQTGEMATCRMSADTLVCKLSADERTAYQDEIDRMQGAVAGLEARVGKLENSLASRLESNLPSEEEFNTTMDYMERFLRTFMGIAKDVENDGGQRLGPSNPDRT